MSENSQQSIVDVKQAARLSGMSVAWWRQRILRREVPHIKIGRSVRIDVTDIQRLLQSGRVEATGGKDTPEAS